MIMIQHNYYYSSIVLATKKKNWKLKGTDKTPATIIMAGAYFKIDMQVMLASSKFIIIPASLDFIIFSNYHSL